MPRTSAVESPGCPPLRALTTDVLGLVKVVEARGKEGIPKVVDTWGPPDASRSIIVASYADHATRPLITVARKNNLVEIFNPLNGNALAAIRVGESNSLDHSVEDDSIVGLHLLRTKGTELSSRLLSCTAKGKASMRSIVIDDASTDPTDIDSQTTWDVCAAGKVICSSVTADEKYALFGGKGVELNMWDLDNCSKTWTAKPPRSNSVGIFSPTWFTSASFIGESNSCIVAGTNNNQVRLYDLKQRRSVLSFDFRESSIKTLAVDPDGFKYYVGTGTGDLASFDLRTGSKLLGCFVGKCCGSIRSIAIHPKLPILASCGLDSYLRIWDTTSRQLLSAVFLKQHLTSVAIDSHFSDEECIQNPAAQPSDMQAIEQMQDEELFYLERCNTQKKSDRNKVKSKTKKRRKSTTQEEDQMGIVTDPATPSEDERIDELVGSKRRKSHSEEKTRSKKHKKIKSKRAAANED